MKDYKEDKNLEGILHEIKWHEMVQKGWCLPFLNVNIGHFEVLFGGMNPVYETAKETLMYSTVLWTLWERERVGRFGRMALKHVKYHVWNDKKRNKVKRKNTAHIILIKWNVDAFLLFFFLLVTINCFLLMVAFHLADVW